MKLAHYIQIAELYSHVVTVDCMLRMRQSSVTGTLFRLWPEPGQEPEEITDLLNEANGHSIDVAVMRRNLPVHVLGVSKSRLEYVELLVSCQVHFFEANRLFDLIMTKAQAHRRSP